MGIMESGGYYIIWPSIHMCSQGRGVSGGCNPPTQMIARLTIGCCYQCFRADKLCYMVIDLKPRSTPQWLVGVKPQLESYKGRVFSQNWAWSQKSSAHTSSHYTEIPRSAPASSCMHVVIVFTPDSSYNLFTSHGAV